MNLDETSCEFKVQGLLTVDRNECDIW